MGKQSLNNTILAYKKLLELGDVQIAYAALVKYVQTVRTEFTNNLAADYSIGHVLQGYMDYTYFYLSNDILKSNKLKFGLVLNHAEMTFELWLLGQTKDVQAKYWKLLKNTKWINTSVIPQYSIFSVTLIKSPDFENQCQLTNRLEKAFLKISTEIMASLKKITWTSDASENTLLSIVEQSGILYVKKRCFGIDHQPNALIFLIFRLSTLSNSADSQLFIF